MKSLAEGIQVIAALLVMLVAIYAGIYATTALAELNRGLKQDRLLHEQMLKDHVLQLKDHEQLMRKDN